MTIRAQILYWPNCATYPMGHVAIRLEDSFQRLERAILDPTARSEYYPQCLISFHANDTEVDFSENLPEKNPSSPYIIIPLPDFKSDQDKELSYDKVVRTYIKRKNFVNYSVFNNNCAHMTYRILLELGIKIPLEWTLAFRPYIFCKCLLKYLLQDNTNENYAFYQELNAKLYFLNGVTIDTLSKKYFPRQAGKEALQIKH